jgi:glycosyltransferase involved in cell wall biosynthesis
MKNTILYVITDGDFAMNKGVPSSNRSYYDVFAKRYTEVFLDVRLLCRVHNDEDINTFPLGGPGVEVIPLPPVHGLLDLFRYGPRLFRTFILIPKENVAVLLRIPGIFPMVAWTLLVLRGIPYSIEVMADADAQFAPGSYNRPFRRFYRVVWTTITALQCRYAIASSYVTRSALQEKFPPAANRPTFNYTTLDLPDSVLAARPRDSTFFQKPRLRLVNVAMMQKHLKGQDVIIHVLAELLKFIDVELWLIGDGDTRPEFEQLASDLGVADRVEFIGRVNAGEDVFQLLDACDIFVLPSRQEGLPRVIIEAMARGLPTYSSDLTGSRELLTDEFLIPHNDKVIWADRLRSAWSSPEFLARASERNLKKVKEYTISNVRPIRLAFYKILAG